MNRRPMPGRPIGTLSLCFWPLLLMAVPAVLWSQDLGDQEFVLEEPLRANTFTSLDQHQVDLDASEDGSFTVVWRDSSYFIRAQRYDSGGDAALPSDFQVNNSTYLNVQWPSVCTDISGNSVVVWQEQESGTSADFDVMARRVDPSLNPIGSFFVVSSYSSGSQIRPDVGCADGGEFIVTWMGAGDSVSDAALGRRFGSDGLPIGDDFQISTEAGPVEASPGGPLVATDANGDFVVVWEHSIPPSLSKGPGYPSLTSRRYDSAGVALDAMQVELFGGSDIYRFDLDKHRGTGEFIVSWNDSTNFGRDVKLRRFDSSGVPLAQELSFASGENSALIGNSVAFAGPNGEIVVAWDGEFSSQRPQAQRFDAELNAIGSAFEVGIDSQQWESDRVQADGQNDGRFILGWSNAGLDEDVYVQQALPAVFADGFESEDTLEWSSTVP